MPSNSMKEIVKHICKLRESLEEVMTGQQLEVNIFLHHPFPTNICSLFLTNIEAGKKIVIFPPGRPGEIFISFTRPDINLDISFFC